MVCSKAFHRLLRFSKLVVECLFSVDVWASVWKDWENQNYWQHFHGRLRTQIWEEKQSRSGRRHRTILQGKTQYPIQSHKIYKKSCKLLLKTNFHGLTFTFQLPLLIKFKWSFWCQGMSKILSQLFVTNTNFRRLSNFVRLSSSNIFWEEIVSWV